jgi:predicted permease
VYDADLWRPWQLDRAAAPVNSHYVAALARLRDGVTVEDARREMIALTAELPERFPRAYGGEFMERFGFTADVESLRSAILGDAERPLWVLLGAVGLVLVLACANVANLFLVRTEGRAREVAVRRALGASNRDLSMHFLSESVIVASLAAGAGVALSALLLPALRALAPDTLPRMDAIAVDARTMLFAAVAALIAALVLGGLPILRHAGTAPASALGEGSRGNAASARGGLRGLLVVAQMALAVVLLAGAGLMLRTAAALRSVDPGFEPEGAVALDFVLPWWEYSTVEQAWGFTSGSLASVRSLPGVQAAGITNRIPMDGPAGCWSVALEDRPEEPCPVMRFVSDGYFAAMGIPVIEGREYEPTDDELRTGSAVVSRSVAESYWDGAFLGRGIRIYGSGPPYHRVVGVVGDVRDQGLTEPAPGTAYFPYRAIEGESQWGPMRDGTLVVRARPGTAVTSLVPQVREAFRTVDPGVAITAVRGLDEVVARSMARTTFTMLLLVLAAGVALVLGAIGLYGVVSYAVSRRRNEIGIRMALGAARQRVARMVLRESLRMIVPGALLGLVAALVFGRVLRSLLFGVEPTDPITLLGVALVLTAVAALAAWLPARRAAAVDPAVSLRAE